MSSSYRPEGNLDVPAHVCTYVGKCWIFKPCHTDVRCRFKEKIFKERPKYLSKVTAVSDRKFIM